MAARKSATADDMRGAIAWAAKENSRAESTKSSRRVYFAFAGNGVRYVER